MDKLAVMKDKAKKVADMKKQMQSLVAMDASFHKKMAEVSDSLK
jgi:putative methionine-R-sulfoxide reductase with GAF domain